LCTIPHFTLIFFSSFNMPYHFRNKDISIKFCTSNKKQIKNLLWRYTALMTFEVLMLLKMVMFVFWALMPCGLVGRYQHLGGTHCPLLRGCTSATWNYNPEDQHRQYYYPWITNVLSRQKQNKTLNTIISFQPVPDNFL
jgi:hypothetical protein